MQQNFFTLISGAGIGAILSAVLVFVSNSKKNQLDYIVKERSEWRKDIQLILDDLKIYSKRVDAIQRLKNRINPYGYEIDDDDNKYYIRDGHIWYALQYINLMDSEQIEKLSYLIRLLWKYDWEKSKKEIKYNLFTLLYESVKYLSMILIMVFIGMRDISTCIRIGYLILIALLLFNNIILNKYNILRWKRRKKNKGILSKEGLCQYSVLIFGLLLPYWLLILDLFLSSRTFNTIKYMSYLYVFLFVLINYVMFSITRYLSTAEIEYKLKVRSFYKKNIEKEQN